MKARSDIRFGLKKHVHRVSVKRKNKILWDSLRCLLVLADRFDRGLKRSVQFVASISIHFETKLYII